MNKLKKILISFLAVVLVLVVLLSFVGPHIVLMIARQPEVEENYSYSDSFYNSYDEIRKHLGDRVSNLREEGITVEVSEYAVDENDDLYIDNIYLPSKNENKNLIVLTTGVHGMEGYIGSVMLDVFFEEIYPTIDTDTTGVLVVANVNPYGMKYMRRYNENKVDLNRNFILDWDSFDLTSNKDYPEVKEFLQPEGAVGNALWHEVEFYANLAKEALTKGADKVSDALLTGQYEYAQGVYIMAEQEMKFLLHI